MLAFLAVAAAKVLVSFNLTGCMRAGMCQGDRDAKCPYTNLENPKQHPNLTDRHCVLQDLKLYRAEKNGWCVVARYSFLALLNFSAWPCLDVA